MKKNSKGFEALELETSSRLTMVDITELVRRSVTSQGVTDGIAIVYCPHTTGAITINEGADPDVQDDVTRFLETLVPHLWKFKHREGNSDSHVKTSLVGASETIIIDDGDLVLGTWQRVFFCEFDGPRRRRFFVKTISS